VETEGLRSQALLLAAHGSAINAEAGAAARGIADGIRMRALFDDVRAAFLRQDPPLDAALEALRADDIYVVPLLLSEGVHARDSIPRALGLTGPVTRRGGRTIHLTPPVGTHPRIREAVLRRAALASDLAPAHRAAAALILIGHGNPDDPDAAATVEAAADAVRRDGPYALVATGYIEQEPNIRDVVDRVQAPDLVLVPFFIAEGFHTRQTIPRLLGLTGAHTVRSGRTLWYARPVGTDPVIVDIVLDRARAAGARVRQPLP